MRIIIAAVIAACAIPAPGCLACVSSGGNGR
jgi:hypothetical protein